MIKYEDKQCDELQGKTERNGCSAAKVYHHDYLQQGESWQKWMSVQLFLPEAFILLSPRLNSDISRFAIYILEVLFLFYPQCFPPL